MATLNKVLLMGRLTKDLELRKLEWRRLGPDLLLTARINGVAR